MYWKITIFYSVLEKSRKFMKTWSNFFMFTSKINKILLLKFGKWERR